MAAHARRGVYDDFLSPLAFPKIALVRNLISRNKQTLVVRVQSGEFDNTAEEAREAAVDKRFS